MPGGFRSGVVASLLYILSLVPRAEWHGGWAPPLRYVVVFMPVFALGAASVWRRINGGVIALIAIWTAGLVAHGVAFPYRLFHIANGENEIGEGLSRAYRTDFSRLFPSFIRLNEAAVVAAVTFLAILGVRSSIVGFFYDSNKKPTTKDLAPTIALVTVALAAMFV